MLINGVGRCKTGESGDCRYEVREVRKWAQTLVRYADSRGYVSLRANKMRAMK